MSNALDIYPRDKIACPFFDKKYEACSGSDHHHCSINHWLMRTQKLDYPDLTCDCFGVTSSQCPLQQYSEIRVRAGAS